MALVRSLYQPCHDVVHAPLMCSRQRPPATVAALDLFLQRPVTTICAFNKLAERIAIYFVSLRERRPARGACLLDPKLPHPVDARRMKPVLARERHREERLQRIQAYRACALAVPMCCAICVLRRHRPFLARHAELLVFPKLPVLYLARPPAVVNQPTPGARLQRAVAAVKIASTTGSWRTRGS